MVRPERFESRTYYSKNPSHQCISDITLPERACYHCRMFNFGRPKTSGDWIVHIAGAIVAIFLVWWMLRVYVL